MSGPGEGRSIRRISRRSLGKSRLSTGKRIQEDTLDREQIVRVRGYFPENRVDSKMWFCRVILTVLLAVWIASLTGCGVQGMPIPPEDVKKQKSSS